MTAPDPKVLAAAITLADEGLRVLSKGIDDPEIKKEVELNQAIVSAAKAYGPMREALEGLLRVRDWCIKAYCTDGPLPQDFIVKFAEMQAAAVDAARAALNGEAVGWQPIDTAPKSTTTPTPRGHDVEGIYLLGFCPEEGEPPENCICIIWWEPHHHGDHKGAWVGEACFEVVPTHWQYPPTPPAALKPAGPA